MENKKNIPIFYACDEGFVKFSIVSIFSLMQNASPDYTYTIYILHSGIPADQQQKGKLLFQLFIDALQIGKRPEAVRILLRLPVQILPDMCC